MNIQPYSILMTDDNKFILTESIVKRKASHDLKSEDYIVMGVLFKKNVGLEGDCQKSFLNLRTASYKQIKNFINANPSSCEESTWLYLNEITAIVNRDPIIFKVNQELEVV